MARIILCIKCEEKTRVSAEREREFFQSVIGEALREYMCDQCGEDIAAGDRCSASVLLDGEGLGNERNSWQAVENWYKEYVK